MLFYVILRLQAEDFTNHINYDKRMVIWLGQRKKEVWLGGVHIDSQYSAIVETFTSIQTFLMGRSVLSVGTIAPWITNEQF